MQDSFDYIIVGGGSAGCVIATRIIEQTQARVLLLEAGPSDKDLMIHMPAGLRDAIAKHTVEYVSPENPATGLRAIPMRQAKVLGGGGSVNGMLYVRGTEHDYDDWEKVYGCTGWSHRDVLPYFLRAERNESLSGPLHGAEGYLHVSEHRYRHPLSLAFVRAGQELGYPYLTDISGASGQEGVGLWQCTIINGERGSASRVYLSRVLDNDRLTVLTGAAAEKILIEQGKAVGVRYSVHGKTTQAYASKEVIITAGAVVSPKLLLLSGIGPTADLRALDIEVHADNAQVGKNYQDHLMVAITAQTPGIPSLMREATGLNKIKAGLEWLTFHHDGVVGTNVLEAGGFFDGDRDGRIDTQVFVQPVYDLRPDQPAPKELPDGLTVKVANVRPQSRGQIRLASKDPTAAPQVQANYLSAPGDLEGHIRAIKLGLSFFEAPSLKKIAKDVSPSAASDEELATFFKRYCTTQFHPTSSCRMGSKPEDSVVDLQLRVWGVENLRVADASVMPHVTSGNTNAPTIMVAERAAEFIIADHPA